ncbi:protein farnesyltransferase subunit beta [Punica granatum]|uniref:Protein farnesyltransferase subunit beta n=1 Tax=Punica granatum TaxID=22663 RepID=A0A6P8C9Y1_PUNGR|nr:protein farnesyltransferase subunit beta [Punica granatum]
MESSSSSTVTQREQLMVEQRVFQIYRLLAEMPRSSQSFMLEVQRDSHIEYLTNGLRGLSPSFCVLDANRPWLCYWILHSLALLEGSIDDELENNAIDFLCRCQDPSGGYAGGPGQMPHLATTYAAVNSLISLGGHRALSSIHRDSIYAFLRQMKQPNGGFRMHDGGEVDVRACYTAISVASILNILDDRLVEYVGDYILSCQTHEGGIAGEPGSEAHGGYTYCGFATMILINEVDCLNVAALMDWVVFRQGVECGFQGRINKLVDGCYSFWQGGVCALLQRSYPIINGLDSSESEEDSDAGSLSSATSDVCEGEHAVEGTLPQADAETCQHTWEGFVNTLAPVNLNDIGDKFLERNAKMGPPFNSVALQQYILLCSQLQEGGFRDKPGKARDFYHTCYCLSGLSACQYSWSEDLDFPPAPQAVLGPYSNLLEPIHPLYNVVLRRYHEAREFFASA